MHDLTGGIYGKLEVIEFFGKDKHGKIVWKCACECGNFTEVRANSLTRGLIKSCGCTRGESLFKDLSGKTFGRLQAINYAGKNNQNLSIWTCRCSCGETVNVIGSSLTNGTTQSCGCYHRQRASESNIRHGFASHPLYQTWLNMIDRCYNSNINNYHNYGGRGISVCDEWKGSLESFIAWGERNGYQPGLSIERENNDGNYEPGNCRWATRTEQAHNRRTNKLDFHKVRNIRNDTRPHREIATDHGIDVSMVSVVKSQKIWKEE